jgi:heme/copper-type cytochrome/quinol oxidase subunit 3
MAAVDAIPLEVAAAPPVRPRQLLIGTAFASAACVMAFAGLIGVYLSTRSAALAEGTPWIPDGATIPLTPGTMAFFTLVLSLVTVQWAVYAVGNNDRQHALVALGLTILFGVCAINAVTFLFTQSNIGVRDSAMGVLFYVISGASIAMIVAGQIFIAVMIIRTVGGEYRGRDREGIVAASLFWYVTVAMYAVVWYALYVTK